MSVELQMEMEHEGEKYTWVCYYTENMSGYDWYKEGVRILDPDWADEYDMNEVFEEHKGEREGL